jgi:surface protein
MFREAIKFNQDISSWNLSNVTRAISMFNGAKEFNQDISSWDVSNITDMSWMFSNASLFNQNLGSWNIEKVTNMYAMFFDANLSTDNYSNMLSTWSGQSVQNDVEFHGGSSKYRADVAGDRQNLIDNFNWTITDAGQVE